MNDKLIEYLDELVQYLKGAEGFVVQQAPLVFQEVISYYFWFYLFVSMFLLALAAFGAWTSYFFLRRAWKFGGGWRSEPGYAASWIIGICSSVSLLFSVYFSRIVFMTCLSPRFFLLEKVSHLLGAT